MSREITSMNNGARSRGKKRPAPATLHHKKQVYKIKVPAGLESPLEFYCDCRNKTLDAITGKGLVEVSLVEMTDKEYHELGTNQSAAEFFGHPTLKGRA